MKSRIRGEDKNRKDRLKEKKGKNASWASTIILIIIWLGIIGTGMYFSHKDNVVAENECLTKIAKDYCESQGEFYWGASWDFGPEFSCRENLRRQGGLRYYDFLPEEVERCLK